jgi:hypothetical protein
MMCAMRTLALSPFLVPLLSMAACNDAKPDPIPPASAPEAPAAQPAPGTPPPQAAAAPAQPAEVPALSPEGDEVVHGDVELELSGALTGTFRGAAATCSRFEADGAQSASIKVMSRQLEVAEDWDLTFMVTSEEEWETPAVILNVRGATRASYTYPGKAPAGESVSVTRDSAGAPTGATIDLTLKEMVGKRAIKIKGFVRCPA